MRKKLKLGYFLIPCTKIHTKWIKDLNIIPETIKYLEENIGSTLSDISLSNTFLDLSPQERETKAKINKQYYITLKKLLHSKGKYQQNEKAAY